LVLVCAVSWLGCFAPGSGVEPPQESIYFPVGLSLDSKAEHLFIVNSDFDLRYNGGTVGSYDLAAIRALTPSPCGSDGDCASDRFCDLTPTPENGGLPSRWCVPRQGGAAGSPCGAFGESSVADRIINPGRCGYVNPERPQDGSNRMRVGSVGIGAFGTDVVYRARPATAPPGPPGRLFVPVRGDATLDFIDVDDNGVLDCGQPTNGSDCDDRHRRGDNPDQENTRGLRLPPEPFGIDATADARALVVTHQTESAVSLFVHEWNDQGPDLEFVLGNLPTRPIGVAAVPPPAIAVAKSILNDPGFLLTFGGAPQIALVRFFDEATLQPVSPARPYLYVAGQVPIQANSVGDDSRGIALDASTRHSMEVACASLTGIDPQSDCARDPDCTARCTIDPNCDAQCASDPACKDQYTDCLSVADKVPLEVYVSNRAPASLLVGRTPLAQNAWPPEDLPEFHESVPLTFGPSRVVLGDVRVSETEWETRVFVVAFDSRLIFIYDPARRRVEKEIRTGRGPHALAIDSRHGLGYVAHFTDSYIGVISLDQRFPSSYGTILMTFGRPTPPRASK
jgi:DNA-binding beta-propeller fold protein YncE